LGSGFLERLGRHHRAATGVFFVYAEVINGARYRPHVGAFRLIFDADGTAFF
jgi:hypothetical protein